MSDKISQQSFNLETERKSIKKSIKLKATVHAIAVSTVQIHKTWTNVIVEGKDDFVCTYLGHSSYHYNPQHTGRGIQ